MQPICTYPRVARSTASPAHEANGWSLLDLPRQASLQPRRLATHHSGQESFSDPRLFQPRDMYAVAALSTASALLGPRRPRSFSRLLGTHVESFPARRSPPVLTGRGTRFSHPSNRLVQPWAAPMFSPMSDGVHVFSSPRMPCGSVVVSWSCRCSRRDRAAA